MNNQIGYDNGMNTIQNIPIRTELGKRIRSYYIKERDGYDYQHLEVRVLQIEPKDLTLKNVYGGSDG